MVCKNIQELFIDHLEGKLDETRRPEFEQHVESCEQCKLELKELEQIIASLESEQDAIQIPDNFMVNVRQAVTTTQKQRRKIDRRPAMTGLVAALFLMLFVGTAVATNGFASFMEWWKDFGDKQNEQMKNYVQHGLGDYVNIEAESNGIKITVTSVVADDIQTLIYYEIENKQKENKYMINYNEGLHIVNQGDIWSGREEPFDPPVHHHLSLYSESDHVYKGRLGTAPLTRDEGTIQLELSKIQKVIDTADGLPIPGPENNEFIEGEWHFDIPVKKHPAIVHELHTETEIEGNPVIFDKLTVAPTITVLSYRYRNENPDRRMDFVTIASLESKGKHVYGDPLGVGSFGGSGGYEGGWNKSEATFESLYLEKPTDVHVHIGSASFTIKEQADFAIDVSKTFPQTFEYLGTSISIENIEVGQPTKITLSEELNANRVYQSLDYRFYDKDNRGSSNSSVDGYYIDKNGARYNAIENFYRLNELEQPRFFSTQHHIELSREDQDREMIPVGMEIEGYQTTSFYDQVVDISLE